MEISFKQTLFTMEPKNKRCIDCGDKNVNYISVNNGITICDLCAQIHRQLGPQISDLRKIDEELDDYSMNFFIHGGNKNFKKKLKELGVDLDMQRSKLYQTYGVDYYRKYLKAKVEGIEMTDKIPSNPNKVIQNEEGNKVNEDNNINNFLNINNNAGNKTNVNDEEDHGESHIQLNYHNNHGFIDNNNKKSDKKTDKKGILRLSVNKVKSIGGYIKRNSVKGIGSIKKAGNLIAQKSKPAAEKIKSTAKYMGEHIPYFHKSKVKSQEDIRADMHDFDENNYKDDINKEKDKKE